MRIQCISTVPSAEQVKLLGSAFREGRTKYPVHEGIEYMVLGLGVWNGVAWVEIAMETETVVSVPLFLFQITDARPSRLWEIRTHADGAVTLWPAPFYDSHFHDRLSDGEMSEVATLRRIQQQIAAEEAAL